MKTAKKIIMLEVKACIPCMFDKKRHKGPLTAVVYCTTVYNLNQVSCVSHRSFFGICNIILFRYVSVCLLSSHGPFTLLEKCVIFRCQNNYCAYP